MEFRDQLFTTTVDGQHATTNFRLTTLGESSMKSPDAQVKIDVIDVQPVGKSVVAEPAAADDPKALPVLTYTLQGPMMGRNDGLIFYNERDDHIEGLAEMVFIGGAPPETSVVAPSRERFFVFHKDGQVINAVEHGEATHAKAKLIERGGSGSGFDLQLEFQDKT